VASRCGHGHARTRSPQEAFGRRLPPVAVRVPNRDCAPAPAFAAPAALAGRLALTCAAALANINFMEKENLPARATETGNYATTKLRALQKHHPLIGEVRGLGLMIGVELVKDEKLTPATTEAEAIRDALLRNGVLVGVGGIHGNVIRFQPPLIITRQQIDQAIDAFAAAVREVAQPAAV